MSSLKQHAEHDEVRFKDLQDRIRRIEIMIWYVSAIITGFAVPQLNEVINLILSLW